MARVEGVPRSILAPAHRFARRRIPPDLWPVFRVSTACPLADHLHPRWLSRGSSSPQHLRRDRSEVRPPSTALSSNASRFLFAPPPGFGCPPDGLLPIVPCGAAKGRPQRSRDSPFGAFPRPDGYRFPGPCLLAVPWWRSTRPLRVRFKASFPGRSTSRSWIDLPVLPWDFPLGSSPALPWLSVFPGPSSSTLSVHAPCGNANAAP
jgi:hypothetical protein